MYNCLYCDKQISSKSNLTKHNQICKKRDLVESQQYLQILREQYEKENRQIREQYEKENRQIREQYEKEIQMLKEQLTEFKNQIFEIAKQPKTTVTNQTTQTHTNNRNTAIINQLAPYDLTKEQITQLFYNYFKLNTFHGGPDEIAKLTAQVILTDPETQKPKVVCTDLSRKNFKYVDDEQEVQVDPGFQKTHDLIKEPLSKANIRVFVDDLQKDDQYHDQWRKNEDFISDRTGFSDKLVKWMV
jgi:hypothetical protein